jgi:hypothetical protein
MSQNINVRVILYIGWQGLPGNKDRVARLEKMIQLVAVPHAGSVLNFSHGSYPIKDVVFYPNSDTVEVIVKDFDENGNLFDFKSDEECTETIAELVESEKWSVLSDGVFTHTKRS